MKEVNKLMTDELRKSIACRNMMLGEAKHWKAVNIISSFLNNEGYTYDEFVDIFQAIDHFTHHEAEIQEFHDCLECEEECTDRCHIDIDEEDGEWFVIPEIG